MIESAGMPKVVEGQLSAAGLRFAIVASRFNGLIVEPLIAGAVDAIVRTGGRNLKDVRNRTIRLTFAPRFFR